MRLCIKVLCFLSLISILAIGAPSSYAQSIDPIEVLSSSQYYQGDNGFVEVWIKNNGSMQVGITSVSAHFSWIEGPNVFNLTLSSTVNIDVGAELYIGKINFTVPLDTSVGYHSYYLYIEFESPPGGEKHTWQTSDYSVWVEDQYKKLCDDFTATAWSKLANARQNLTDAQSAIQALGSPQSEEANPLLLQAQSKLEEAQTYLDQAENAYSNASKYYASREFQDAYTSFQECANAADNASAYAAEASSLAAQAQQKEVEQQQQQQQQQQQRQIQQMMLFGILIAIVVAALIVIVIIIKRR